MTAKSYLLTCIGSDFPAGVFTSPQLAADWLALHIGWHDANRAGVAGYTVHSFDTDSLEPDQGFWTTVQHLADNLAFCQAFDKACEASL